jgi:hypothetical protein
LLLLAKTASPRPVLSGRNAFVIPPPRTSACGLSPGLCSPGPLGRTGAGRSRRESPVFQSTGMSSVAARDAAWTAHAGRADASAVRGAVLADWAAGQAVGAKAGRIGGNAQAVRAKVPPVGAVAAFVGAASSGHPGKRPGGSGKSPVGWGETLLTHPSLRALEEKQASPRRPCLYVCFRPGVPCLLLVEGASTSRIATTRGRRAAVRRAPAPREPRERGCIQDGAGRYGGS